MRHARLKPDYRDTWHHCYNHTVGTRSERPLDDADKEQFIRIVKRLAAFYCVRVVACQVLSNHFHLLLQTPQEAPSEEEAARRYAAFHKGARNLWPGTAACREWTLRLRDVSWFMRHLQHLYTAWYNRTRAQRRRGPLWAGRFKNTVLEPGAAVWACWAYIERNAFRAGLVADPADYRFCSYGEWAQTGRHPFAEALATCLAPILPPPLAEAGAEGALEALRLRFARDAADEAGEPAPPEAPDIAFTLSATRRVRHWTDGLAIGSELFVREALRRARYGIDVTRHRLARSAPSQSLDAESPALYCWRRLRVNPD